MSGSFTLQAPHTLLGQLYAEVVDILKLDKPSIYRVLDDEGAGSERFARSHDGAVEVLFGGDDVLHTIFINSDVLPSLPYQLNVQHGPAEVHAALGSPSGAGAQFIDSALGEQGSWERWDYAEYSLHIQFQPGGSGIARVTVTRPPGQRCE